MDNKQISELDASERRLFSIVRIALGVVLFPVITLLAVGVLAKIEYSMGVFIGHEVGLIVFDTISSAIIGLATSIVFVRKAPVLSRNFRVFSRLGLREPIVSCLKYGIGGATLFGGLILAGILLLGHTRPVGWDFSRIPWWMGIGFVACGLAGLDVGRKRKSARRT